MDGGVLQLERRGDALRVSSSLAPEHVAMVSRDELARSRRSSLPTCAIPGPDGPGDVGTSVLADVVLRHGVMKLSSPRLARLVSLLAALIVAVAGADAGILDSAATT